MALLDDSNTKALLHFDGADASTTITDESGKTWTAYGNAQLDTAQAFFGSSSLLLDGNGDYIASADHADWYFGTGDFTVDCWFRFAVVDTTSTYTFFSQLGDASHYYNCYYYNGGIYFQQVNGSLNINILNYTPTISANTWYHFAVIKVSNVYRFFINGVQFGTDATDADEVADFAGPFEVGRINIAGYYGYLNGWLDEYRVSKGIARWTTNFTPPPAPYPYSKTIRSLTGAGI